MALTDAQREEIDLRSKVDKILDLVEAMWDLLEHYRPLLERMDPGSNPVASWAARRAAKKKPCRGCGDHPSPEEIAQASAEMTDG